MTVPAWQARYTYEYDIGEWDTLGRILVLKERGFGGVKRVCKTVPKSVLLHRGCDIQAVRSALQRLEGLTHPYLCQFVEFLEDESALHLLSEHLEGGDVSDLLAEVDAKTAWLDERAVAAYIMQLLAATAYCHSRKVFHGDLRVRALGLTSRLPDARVKAQDFGLAQLLGAPSAIDPRVAPDPLVAPELRLSGGLMGRQQQGAAAFAPGAEKRDLWSIGALSYFLLANELPFKGQLLPGDPKASAHLRWPSPRFMGDDGWGDRSTASRDFIRRLLRPEPSERLTAARALQHPWIRTWAAPTPLAGHFPQRGGAAEKAALEFQMTADLRLRIRVLALLLAPMSLEPEHFEDLGRAFSLCDTDKDGLLGTPAELEFAMTAMGLIRTEATDSTALKAMEIADAFGVGSFDLCALLIAAVITQCLRSPWNARGLGAKDTAADMLHLPGGVGIPTGEPPLATQNDLENLERNLLRQVLELSQVDEAGGREKLVPSSHVDPAALARRVRASPVARQIEAACPEVRYGQILLPLQKDKAPLDAPRLGERLKEHTGAGTPFERQFEGRGHDAFDDSDLDDAPGNGWSGRIADAALALFGTSASGPGGTKGRGLLGRTLADFANGLDPLVLCGSATHINGAQHLASGRGKENQRNQSRREHSPDCLSISAIAGS